MSENQNKLLTKQQMNTVAEDVIVSFESELSRLLIRNQVTSQTILQTILEWHYDQPLYTMFTSSAVKNYTDLIFTDDKLRDFIMNVTERTSFKWSSSDLSYDDVFLNTYAEAICRNKTFNPGSKNDCLIDEATQATISATTDTVRKMLAANMWYFVLFMILMNLEFSGLFNALKKQTQDNAKK